LHPAISSKINPDNGALISIATHHNIHSVQFSAATTEKNSMQRNKRVLCPFPRGKKKKLKETIPEER
jgi:hypothetical protein